MRVLLTGATGFVGSHLHPVLVEAGHSPVCLTRHPEAGRERHPEWEWRAGDLQDEEAALRAMEGCEAAFYLVHGMADHAGDFRRRERETAERFARAAERAGLRRILYLGGFRPQGKATEHLASRLEVGEALRAGRVPCLELRSSMIVGKGSTSWLMVRDLAARLPAMLLPSWLKSRTQPVALEDVLTALSRGLDLPLDASASYDLPGPDTLSGKEVLETVTQVMGLPRALLVEVPVLSPWLSSHWIHFVTRAEWSVAREVVLGMATDFMARDAHYWKLIGVEPLSFREAARRALAAEMTDEEIPGLWGNVERWMKRRVRRPAARA